MPLLVKHVRVILTLKRFDNPPTFLTSDEFRMAAKHQIRVANQCFERWKGMRGLDGHVTGAGKRG